MSPPSLSVRQRSLQVTHWLLHPDLAIGIICRYLGSEDDKAFLTIFYEFYEPVEVISTHRDPIPC
jgi:hypothetical protein